MKPITILYGTETGNAEYCANQIGMSLQKRNMDHQILDMQDCVHEDLPEMNVILVITSTYGEGDPPYNARDLHSHLKKDQPNLSNVQFAVLALGDSTYENFAQCGKDFDKMLGDLGGHRMFNRIDCDYDFEVPMEQYTQELFAYFGQHKDQFPTFLLEDQAVQKKATPSKSTATSTKKKGFWGMIKGWFGSDTSPLEETIQNIDAVVPKTPPPPNVVRAKLLENKLLSKENSNKETRHYEFELMDTAISFAPGDCFAVVPHNCPDEVQRLITLLSFHPETMVQWSGKDLSLQRALTEGTSLRSVTLKLVDLLARNDGPAKQARAEKPKVEQYMRERHVFDALQEQEMRSFTEQEFVAALRPIPPRLYSLANSPLAVPNQVHFTVETLRYSFNERRVKGVASCWLSDLDMQTVVDLKLHPNDQFRLPSSDVPIIMIGPGTGIAPFRAFLQERQATNASGKSWLFFGHQHQKLDFLYEEEINEYLQDGTLDALHCAWSRDTDKKVYVQHLLLQEGATVWEWINQQAVIYVCGDAKGMAPGVHDTLIAIVEKYGAVDGASYIKEMETSGRYLRDVY